MVQRDVWLLMLGVMTAALGLLESKGKGSAGQLLRSRRPRANTFLLEELRSGSLERECYEETCSQEEAAEIFQSHEKTMEFWYRYTNWNPCLINQCLNGGICTVDRGQFLCLCPPQFYGDNCQTEIVECRYRNGGCLQYCTDQNQGGKPSVQCGCAGGYQLEPDGQRCSKTVPYPCGKKLNQAYYRSRSLWPESSNISETNVTMETDGATTTTLDLFFSDNWDNSSMEDYPGPIRRQNQSQSQNQTWGGGRENTSAPWWGEEEGEPIMSARIVGGLLERQRESPWQVLIRRADGYGFCGGTLVSDRWVVSAAHCFKQHPEYITVGDYDKRRVDRGEQIIRVEAVFVHPHFHSFTFDSDLALLYLARPVRLGPSAIPACLPSGQLASYLDKEDSMGVVTGWGAMQYMGRSSRFLRKVALPVVSQQNCMRSTEQVITDNMFCAGYREANMDACSGDSGGPFVVNYRGTWFLTGVVSWGEECAAKEKYGVYTRLGNFLSWIQDTMSGQRLNHTLS